MCSDEEMEGEIAIRDTKTKRLLRIEYQPWHKNYGTVLKFTNDGRTKQYKDGMLHEIGHDNGDKEMFYKVDGDQIKCVQFQSGGRVFYRNGEKYLVEREDGRTELHKNGQLMAIFSVDKHSIKLVEHYEDDKRVGSQYMYGGAVLDSKAFYELLIRKGEREEDAKKETEMKFLPNNVRGQCV